MDPRLFRIITEKYLLGHRVLGLDWIFCAYFFGILNNLYIGYCIGPSYCQFCHAEGIGCSTSYGAIKSQFEFQRISDHLERRFKIPFSGATPCHWLPIGRKICFSTVSVAADYSDSVPESSNYVAKNGYHPLEELKSIKRVRETKLTDAEIAKTTIEANKSALLMFPGTVHCEPHEHVSWAEYQYVIDDYGDIYFEVPDALNILQDPGASNPVNALIGMDIPLFKNQRFSVNESISDGFIDDLPFGDDYFEVEVSDMFDGLLEWGMSDTSSFVHPIFFAKCLTKAVDMGYARRMDHPSNGLSILGCLRPAFVDEEIYLRRLFNGEDSDGYASDWKDGEILNFDRSGDGKGGGSMIYRLEIMRIELFSVYGVQAAINLQDFRDAEADILVCSIPEILEHFSEKRMMCNSALRALCKKNGIFVEDASIIGVDSLGMDVRVFSGPEVQTHRFPFKVRATSEGAAEKQIHQLLFPPSRRKRPTRTRTDKVREMD